MSKERYSGDGAHIRSQSARQIAEDCRRLAPSQNVFDLLTQHQETNPRERTPRKKTSTGESKWIKAQETTFIRWVNERLKCTSHRVTSIENDFQDGVYLIELLQALAGKKLARKWYSLAKVHVQKVENMNQAFEFIKDEGMALVSIDPLQIVKGDHKLIMALIWHLILHYQIGSSKTIQLLWFNMLLPGANIKNFTADWKDGHNLAALVEYYMPGLMDLPDDASPLEIIKKAMTVAEKQLDVPQIIDPENLATEKPDDQLVLTYLSFFYCPDSVGEKQLLHWYTTTISEGVTNFTTDWSDWNAFSDLVNYFVPNSKRPGNGRRALLVASRRLGVEQTFKTSDVEAGKLDRLAVMAYVVQFRHLDVQQPYTVEEDRIDTATEQDEREEEERLTREEEEARQEEARLKKEQEEARLKKDQEEARLKKEQGEARLKKEQEEARLKKDQEETRLKKEQGEARLKKEQGERLKMEQDDDEEDELVVGTPKHEQSAPEVAVVPYTLNEPDPFMTVDEDPETAAEDASEPPLQEPSATLRPKTPELVVVAKPITVHLTVTQSSPPSAAAHVTSSALSTKVDSDDEDVFQEAFQEVESVFQHTLEKKAIKRNIPVNFDSPVTQSMPDQNDVAGDNVSLSISDILQSEDEADWGSMPSMGRGAEGDGAPKPEKCLVTGRGIYRAATGQLTSFTVDCTQGGRGALNVTIKSQRGETLDVHRDRTSESIYKFNYVPLTVGNYTITVEWGDRHIPGSPFTCEVLDPALCIASGTGLTGSTVNYVSSFHVATKGAGNGAPSVSARGPSGAVEVYETGSDGTTYFYEYEPDEPGTYVIDFKWSGYPIPGSPFQVKAAEQLTMITGEVVVRDLPTHRVQANKPVSVVVDTTKAGSATLKAVAQGPSSEEDCEVTETAPGLYAVGFTPKEIGEYTVCVLYDESPIPDSPLPITVNDPTKCAVDVASLPQGLQRTSKPVSVRVLTNLAGEGEVTATVKGPGSEPCEVRQESDGVWVVSCVPRSRGKYFIDVVFDNCPILKAPISFDVGDVIDQIILTKPVSRTGHFPTNNPLEFIILAPGINPGELTVAAHGTKTGATPTIKMGASDETYTVLFTASDPDDYKVEISYQNRQVSGSPFVVTVRHQPSPEKVFMYDPVLPLVAGKPIELFFNTSQAGDGNLSASISSVGGENVTTHMQEIFASLHVISFVPPREGAYTANITWAGKPVSVSPLQLLFEEQKKEPFVCVVFESSTTLKAKLQAFITRKSTGTEVELQPRQFERGKYQIGFQPPEKDVYLLKVLEFGKEVSGSPFTLDLLAPRSPGKGVLDVTVDGKKSGSIKPALHYDSVFKTAKIQFTSSRPDVYELNVYWNKKRYPGCPVLLQL